MANRSARKSSTRLAIGFGSVNFLRPRTMAAESHRGPKGDIILVTGELYPQPSHTCFCEILAMIRCRITRRFPCINQSTRLVHHREEPEPVLERQPQGLTGPKQMVIRTSP